MKAWTVSLGVAAAGLAIAGVSARVFAAATNAVPPTGVVFSDVTQAVGLRFNPGQSALRDG